jgi:hypothetical protein
MKKNYLIFLSILIPILISCKKEKVENTLNSNSVKIESYKLTPKNTETELKLTDFKEIPKEIDGCSCIFSETEIKYKAEKYLIATNLDSIAFISINGNIAKLYLVERKFDKNEKDEENYIEIFANQKFKATIEVKKDNTKKSGDEIWWNNGSIKIENEKGKSQTKKFIGECGC